MKNQLSILGAALILGLSFAAGCLLLSNEVTAGGEQTVLSQSALSPLMTIAETAELLRISEDQVMNIVKAEHAILSNNGPYEGMMLPFIKVDEQFLFNRDGVLNWIQSATQEKRVYSGTEITNK